MVRKVNSACDWGSGMSAWDRPSLKPGAARRRGHSHEAQKKGRAGADGGGRLARKKKIVKQS